MSMDFSIEPHHHILNCNTRYSPATRVSRKKDPNHILYFTVSYFVHHVLFCCVQKIKIVGWFINEESYWTCLNMS